MVAVTVSLHQSLRAFHLDFGVASFSISKIWLTKQYVAEVSSFHLFEHFCPQALSNMKCQLVWGLFWIGKGYSVRKVWRGVLGFLTCFEIFKTVSARFLRFIKKEGIV